MTSKVWGLFKLKQTLNITSTVIHLALHNYLGADVVFQLQVQKTFMSNRWDKQEAFAHSLHSHGVW